MTAHDGRITSLAEWRATHAGPGEHLGNWPEPGNSTVARDLSPHPHPHPHPHPSEPPTAEVFLGEQGPLIVSHATPEQLWLMAQALLDGARAARNGDDPTEVARQEWHRRGGRPDLD